MDTGALVGILECSGRYEQHVLGTRRALQEHDDNAMQYPCCLGQREVEGLRSGCRTASLCVLYSRAQPRSDLPRVVGCASGPSIAVTFLVESVRRERLVVPDCAKLDGLTAWVQVGNGAVRYGRLSL
jgi:hypothetical protein